jgi:FAD/FMN-containing dehydrogenase
MRLRCLDGDLADIPEPAVRALAATVRGSVVVPGDATYEAARVVWNAAAAARPGIIIRCGGVEDVAAAVRFAGERGLLTAVRGGGHSAAGYGVCDGGLVVDLSPMRAVSVDRRAQVALVEGGATWADVDAATSAAGLVTTGPIVSMTGVGGFTLGGGVGWLHRACGLGCDNLVSAEVVTAGGCLVTADERTNSELFWALRGGGGNFGVVVRFGLRLHAFEGTVVSGLLYYGMEDLRRLARLHTSLVAEAPDELGFCLILRRAPALPELPASLHGRPVFAVAVCAPQHADAALDAIQTFRSAGRLLADLVRPRPYLEWQQALDSAWDKGLYNEWMGHYVDTLDTDAVDILAEYLQLTESTRTDIKIFPLGGAVARLGREATAFAGREASSAIVIQGRWADAAETANQIAWTRELHGALHPFARGDVYVNFVGIEGPDRVLDAYPPPLHARLQTIKARWDPANLFRRNLNIAPLT